jgi:iron complex outermembrane receptor protein
MKYLFILFFILNGFLYPQQTIKGKIVDRETQHPLTKASVLLEGKNHGSISNADGTFSLTTEKDDSLISISYVGYEKKNFPVSFFDETIKLIELERQLISSQTVFITASIGKVGNSSSTFSNINRSLIDKNYTLQDIPEYISLLPSAMFYSEGGNGVGYNYLSIRGFDQRRISISINGIPQNDPEDHNVYWIDFSDILSSVEIIQVQRGAGGGVFGYPAIGGSINIITSGFTNKSFINLSSYFGSYNTKKLSAAFSSGLINNKYSIYAKFSQTSTSGYRNNSWGKFNSFHLSAVRFDEQLVSQLNFFGGPLEDALVYTGLPKFAVNDKNLRRKNFSYWEASNNQFTFTLERKPEELENFFQPHFELLNEYKLNSQLTFNSALFLVLGTGFFDFDGSWADTSYLRLTVKNGFNLTNYPSNIIIRAMVENIQYGWIPRIRLTHSDGELIIGAEIRKHKSLHWGGINFGENLPAGLLKNHRYYEYKGAKEIFNFFANEYYKFNENLNLLCELQMAFNRYRIYDEKYLGNDFKIKNVFLNPRIGISYKYNSDLNIYFSFARVSREPRLKDYYDAGESSGGAVPQFEINSNGTYNFSSPQVEPETMNSFDIGTNLSKKVSNHNLSFNFNFFYMLFKNELVKNGQLDIFGSPRLGNAESTIHTGIEFSSNWESDFGIELIYNITFSKNYIGKGKRYINYYDPITNKKVTTAIDLTGNRISGFPDILTSLVLSYNYNKLLIQLSGKYVGKFYSDNYDSKLESYLLLYPKFISYTENVNDAYFTANIFLSYEFLIFEALQSSKVIFHVNNIFNSLYSAMAIGEEFFPSAERNYNFGIQVGL